MRARPYCTALLFSPRRRALCIVTFSAPRSLLNADVHICLCNFVPIRSSIQLKIGAKFYTNHPIWLAMWLRVCARACVCQCFSCVNSEYHVCCVYIHFCSNLWLRPCFPRLNLIPFVCCEAQHKSAIGPELRLLLLLLFVQYFSFSPLLQTSIGREMGTELNTDIIVHEGRYAERWAGR